MTSLIAWLLGSDAVPSGALVWGAGGIGVAIVLTALLVATTLAIVALRERRREQPRVATDAKAAGLGAPPADSRLPSAA